MKNENSRWFAISDSMKINQLSEMIAYIRFVLFDGNKADLIWANQNAPNGTFKGTNLPANSLALEKEVWNHLCKLAINMLTLLQNNETNVQKPGTTTEEMCISILEEERKIWRYIVDASCAIIPLMSMS